MELCFMDYETYWDQDHSLSKMSPIEYVMHPRTELQLLAVKFGTGRTRVLVGEREMRSFCADVDWSDKFVIAHNGSGFDHIISAWRMDIKPAMWGCTLAMARPVHAKTVGLSLAKLVAHYAEELEAQGIKAVKDQRALIQTRGKRLADFTDQELLDMVEYNGNGDAEQCAGIFHLLKHHFTPAELWHIDCNIRMLVEPQFDLDTGLLETALSIERSNKHKALIDLAKQLQPEGLDWANEPAVAEWVREQMASAPKFCAILESRGVDVPVKQSPTNPDKQVPALAKTDEAFVEMQEHEDPIVAAAARARLAVKSTLLETRIQAFLATGEVCGGRLPVPLKYCGADTTGRDSGCLVAETQVLVYDCLTSCQTTKRIVDVLLTDLVWDGEAFVPHDGVAFSGFSEVVTWDGVTGTEDHVVFTEVGEISLSAARARGVPVQTASDPAQHHLDAARKYAGDHEAPTAVSV